MKNEKNKGKCADVSQLIGHAGFAIAENVTTPFAESEQHDVELPHLPCSFHSSPDFSGPVIQVCYLPF